MPRVPLSHVQTFRPSRVGPLWLGALMLVLAACGSDDPKTSNTGTPGKIGFALELPDGVDIEFVDYTVKLSFLEETPPETYLLEQYHETRERGELTAVVPCHTKPSGTGLNQIDITGLVKVPGRDEPFVVKSSTVFECRENADTLVNITLSIIGQLPAGFLDVDAIPIGTFCSSLLSPTIAGEFGVCDEARCDRQGGDSDMFWVFKATCESVQATNPTFWMCGSPTDWEVNGDTVISRFPPPQHDGTWSWGLVALDGYHMIQVDPTLTDPDGALTVWTGASGAVGTVTRVNGVAGTPDFGTVVYAFAADIELAPQVVGMPPVHLLMLVHNNVNGARTTYQTKFGRCDLPTLGVNLYPGLTNPIMDVRRDGNTAVKLILADPLTGFATLVARCESEWDTTGPAPVPAVRCGAPVPLLPTTP